MPPGRPLPTVARQRPGRRAHSAPLRGGWVRTPAAGPACPTGSPVANQHLLARAGGIQTCRCAADNHSEAGGTLRGCRRLAFRQPPSASLLLSRQRPSFAAGRRAKSVHSPMEKRGRPRCAHIGRVCIVRHNHCARRDTQHATPTDPLTITGALAHAAALAPAGGGARSGAPGLRASTMPPQALTIVISTGGRHEPQRAPDDFGVCGGAGARRTHHRLGLQALRERPG